MINIKRTIVGLLCVILLVCSFIAFTRFTTVNAETAKYFSAEEYTESDNLLNYDGTLSKSETIFTFAKEVHYSEMAAFIPDLSRVVPLQYLENDGTYSYFGKEYGFYMVVEAPYVDLLLVDINYELDDGKLYGEYNRDNVYTMKIEPILQQSFYTRSDVVDGLTWQKYSTANRPVYYIMNPRFITSISNENDLNQGDQLYSKKEDDGIIIQQTMVEYQKMLQSGTIGLEIIPEFLASMALDAVVATLDTAIFHGSLGFMKSLMDFAAGHCDSEQDYSFLTGETVSVFTEQAKETQKEDDNREGYSRTTYFYPEEEIILSEYEGSYAEFSVLVSDADYRTRLSQICEFDIARGIGHMDTPSYFAGNWDDSSDESFFFSSTKVLFDDENPEFVIEENNIDGEALNVYMLANGKQDFEFTPEYSGYFIFDIADSDRLTLTVKDSKQEEVYDNNGAYRLNANEKYIIRIGAPNYKVITSLNVRIEDLISSGTLSAGETIILKLGVNASKVYTLSTSHSQVVISDILIQANNGFTTYSDFIEYVPNSVVDVPLDAGYYYLILHNSASVAENYNVALKNCMDGVVGSVNTIKVDGDNYKFIKLTGLSGGEYVLSADSNEAIWFKVFGENLETIKLTGSGNVYKFVNDYDVLYVGTYSKESVDVIINPTGQAYNWKINNENVNINERNYLEIGDEYDLKFFVNGIEQTDCYKMNCSITGITFNTDALSLRIEYSTPINADFEIVYDNDGILCELMLSTKCDNEFKGIDGVTNDEQITFKWTKTENLTSFTYKLTCGEVSMSYVVDASSNSVGKSYNTDITSHVKEIINGIAQVTITVTEYKVQTPIGVGKRDVNYSAKVNSAYGSGSGVQGDPYIISCMRHFNNLELNKNNSVYFRMSKSFTFTGGKVLDAFYGKLDGNNAYCSLTGIASSYGGLVIHNYGKIENLNLTSDAYSKNINSLYSTYFGSIACYNESNGVINNCSVSIMINNLDFLDVAGGISSINYGSITNCTTYSNVTTSGPYGGIAAINYGKISGCGVNGKIVFEPTIYEGVYQNESVGGIVGENKSGGVVSKCNIGLDVDSSLSMSIDIVKNKDKSLAPYCGPVYGMNSGTVTGCKNVNYYMDDFNLQTWWEWFKTYDQKANINNDFGS